MSQVAHPDIYQISAEVRCSIELEVAGILQSAFFCRSARSCSFLRFVVQAALDGRADLLKERSVGVAVFGRQASYDTGSDAAVRVRASDVRRRLAAYYGECCGRQGWRIELPSGSYRPRFVQTRTEAEMGGLLPGMRPLLLV